MLSSLSHALKKSARPNNTSIGLQKLNTRRPTSSASFSPSARQNSATHFDYNQEYFKETKMRLEMHPVTGQRSLFAKEALDFSEVLLATPYYNHVIHASSQHLFCNACHDSLVLLGLKENALRSKYIKTHRYCSEACRERSAPYDQVMAAPLKVIQKKDPDFYVSNADAIKLVLFTLARKWTESRITLKHPAAVNIPDNTSTIEQAEPELSLSNRRRPKVLKETTLTWSDFYKLCFMDISERNHLLGPKKREEWLEIDRKIRLYLFDSPLMSIDVTPLEILLRDASNSFSVDKYDRRAPLPEALSTTPTNQDHDPSAPERPELESSGYATFPLASYFNHNCRPNCSIGFDMNANIVVKTTRTIEEGEELTISYNAGDLKSPIKDDLPFKSLMRRCKKLCKEVWCFECDCVDL